MVLLENSDNKPAFAFLRSVWKLFGSIAYIFDRNRKMKHEKLHSLEFKIVTFSIFKRVYKS